MGLDNGELLPFDKFIHIKSILLLITYLHVFAFILFILNILFIEKG